MKYIKLLVEKVVKRKRIILIICACVCAVLAGAVLFTGLWQPKHSHNLGDARTYHICNDSVYYTRTCNSGCQVKFDTKASFSEVISSVREQDNIVLDEDIELTEELVVKSIVGQGEQAQGIELKINLDLNNHTITTAIDEKTNDSMFMINANMGSVEFNIKNGKLTTDDLLYIFRFKNTRYVGENITINIKDVDCTTTGVQTTPLFVHNECYNIKINATDSKFISKPISNDKGKYGVGAFINSDSVLNFEGCYFEGGDGVYVRSGDIEFRDCRLVNSGLVAHTIQNVEKFSAVGAAFVVDNHATNAGISNFQVDIINCSMECLSSFKTIYVIETAEDGAQMGVNQSSMVNVYSCKFTHNPTALTIPQYSLVKYPGGNAPTNQGVGVWACGLDVE